MTPAEEFTRDMKGMAILLVVVGVTWRISSVVTTFLDERHLLMPVVFTLWLLSRYRDREPVPPPSAFAGTVTILLLVLMGVCMMIRNETGHDPLDDWGASLWAVLWGFAATHSKVRHRVPHAYTPIAEGLVSAVLVLPLPSGLRFEAASVLMGLLFIMEARRWRPQPERVSPAEPGGV